MRPLLLTLFISFILFSCSEKETDTPALTGKWSLLSKELVRSTDGKTISYPRSECQRQSVYEFGDKELMLSMYDTVGGECTLKVEFKRGYTFDASVMKLWFTDEGGAVLYVTRLTSTELVLEDWDHNYDPDTENDTLREFYTRID
jgi:hypothetical protein